MLSLNNKKCYNTCEGFVTLISMLVVGAIGISVTLSLMLLGLGSSRSSFALEQSNQAQALANACAQEALEQIRENSAFSGTGGLTLGEGSCDYTVTDLGGESRSITGSGTVGTIVSKFEIQISAIYPVITPTSWQEVAD